MVNSETVDRLRKRYPNIYPLLFHRSVERARSNGDLFDILDSIPDKYPLVWNEESYRWVRANDIYQSDEFLGEL